MVSAIELISNFNAELNQAYELPSIGSDEILFFINKAQDNFVSSTYLNFEKSQKIVDDLKVLVVTTPFLIPAVGTSIPLPLDYLHLLRLRIYHTGSCVGKYKWEEITVNGVKYNASQGKFYQLDDLSTALDDPFNWPTQEYPIYTITGNNINVYLPDEPITLLGGIPTYLRKIKLLTVYNPNTEKQFTGREYTNNGELPDYCYTSILSDAVRMCLQSKGDSRYNTKINETNID
jgi:hypothetical protein